jgi:hypothetical protein
MCCINTQEGISKLPECFNLKLCLNTQGKNIISETRPYRGQISLILVECEMPLCLQFVNPHSGGVCIIGIKLNNLPINVLPNTGNFILCEIMVPLIITKLSTYTLLL